METTTPQTTTTEGTPVAMVRADAIAYSVIDAFAVPRRTKEEKAAGIKVATAKAVGFARQGAMPALLAASGVNTKANMQLTRAQGIGACVAGNQVRFALAIRNVLAAAELPDSFELDVQADGQQVAKRADWLRIGDRLRAIVQDPASKKAAAKRAGVALKLWTDIQALADVGRTALQGPALTAAVGEAMAGAPGWTGAGVTETAAPTE